jgi:Flp pilus assembly protein TadG
MKLFRDEAGQTLVLTALLMCVLMGFMALAIDMGVTFRAQRRIQTQADAAAIAAALCGTYSGNFCKAYSGATDVASVAQAAAQANGMPSSVTASAAACTSSPCMQIHQGAIYGQHTSGYYEAIILAPSANIFMSTFSGLFNSGSTNFGSMTVGARAVAGSVPGQACMYLLNDTADKSLYIKGNGTINASRCSIQVNSNANDALCTTGGSGQITSQQIIVVGQQGGAGNCNNTQNNVQTGGGSGKDPLAGMTIPGGPTSTTPCPSANIFGLGTATNPASNVTLTETGGVITLAGTVGGVAKTLTIQDNSTNAWPPTGVAGSPTVNLMCFSDSNVTVSGTIGADSTSNTMFDFLSGVNIGGGNTQVTINGTLVVAGGDFQEANANLLILGPTGQATGVSGEPYTGMALLVPSTGVTCSSSISSMGTVPAGDGCLQVQFGSGGSNPCAGNPSSCSTCTTGSNNPGIRGTIYAPKDVLYLQDNGGCVSATNLVVDELWNKASDLTITNYNLVYTTSPLDVVRLVE